MKPLEYFFVIVLYLFDTAPEDRIAVQYMGGEYDMLQNRQVRSISHPDNL